MEVPDSVTKIGDRAFADCDSLETATMPALAIPYLHDSAINLKTVVITSGESIADMAFWNCESLTSVVIPEGVKSIGEYAFKGCTSLTGITIPEGVKSIGWEAFYGCTSLTNVVIPNSVTSIDYSAFAYCTSLTSIKYRGTKSQWNAISKSSSWNDYSGNYTITYNYTGE